MKTQILDVTPRRFCRRLRGLAPLWLLLWLTPGLIQAATRTWTGGSAISSQWNYTGNWEGGQVPQNGDDLVFPAGAARLVNTNTYSDRRFRSIAIATNGYSIHGNPITLSNGISATILLGSSFVYLPITLGASQTFQSSSALGALQMAGDIDLGSHTLTVQGDGHVMLDGVVSGVGGLAKDGTGTLWIGGNRQNSYEGVTRVNQGHVLLHKMGAYAIPYGELVIGDGVGDVDSAEVNLRESGQITSSVPIAIHSDGSLDLSDYDNYVGELTFNGGLASSRAGTLRLVGSLSASSAGGTISGKLELRGSQRNVEVASGGNLLVDAAISGTAFGKSGGGFLILRGTNSYSGQTVVAEGIVEVHSSAGLGSTNGETWLQPAGTLRLVSATVADEWLEFNGGKLQAIGASSGWTGPVTLATNSTIDVPNAGQLLNLSGPISGPGGFTKTGNGVLRLSGSEGNTYEGDTLVRSGTLELGKTAGTGVAIRHGRLTIGDGIGGELADGVRFLENNQFWSTVPVTLSSSGLLDLNGHADTVGALTFSGGRATSGAAGGMLYLAGTVTATNGSGTIQGNVTVASTCTFNAAEPAGANLYLQAHLTGSGGLTKTGPGQLYLSSSNSYQGVTTVSEGSVYADHDFALGTTNGGTSVSEGAALVLRNDTHIGGEALTLSGNGQSTLGALASIYGSNSWAGPITLAGLTRLTTLQTSDFLHLSGPVGGGGGLALEGLGKVLFSGANANTFAGITVVNGGTLLLDKQGVDAALPGPGALVIGDGAGGNESDIVRELRGYQIAGSVDITVNASGLLDLNDHSDAVGGLILNLGTIRTGAGTLTLGGDVAANGASALQPSEIYGHLALGSVNRTFTVTPGALFVELAIFAEVSGSGGLIKAGQSAMSLLGNNTYAGLTTVNEGELVLSSDTALGSTAAGTIVHAGASIELASAHDRSVHVGAEPLTLSGRLIAGASGFDTSNSWAGPITLASNIVVDVSEADYLNLTGPVSGAGGFTKLNHGTLLLTGSEANTYTGDTRVNSGTLRLGKTVANSAIIGNLYIGDGTGGAGADVVRLEGNNQIANTADVTLASSGLLDLNGYFDRVNVVSGRGGVTLGSGHLIAGHSGSSFTFDGLVSGTGYLWKVGAGTWTLTANNTYSGTTRIENGTLIVNGSQPGSDLLILSGGTLGGKGTVGAITAEGRVAPGTSPGLLASSNLTFAGTGEYLVELTSASAGTGHDQVSVRGNVALGNAALVLSATGLLPAEGQQFVIISNDRADALTGTFAGLPEGALVSAGPRQFLITYEGGTGNDVVLIATNTAPLRPALSIQRTATNTVVLSWPQSDTAWRLHATTNLASAPIPWTELPPPYASNLTECVVIEPAPAGSRFYRLHAP